MHILCKILEVKISTLEKPFSSNWLMRHINPLTIFTKLNLSAMNSKGIDRISTDLEGMKSDSSKFTLSTPSAAPFNGSNSGSSHQPSAVFLLVHPPQKKRSYHLFNPDNSENESSQLFTNTLMPPNNIGLALPTLEEFDSDISTRKNICKWKLKYRASRQSSNIQSRVGTVKSTFVCPTFPSPTILHPDSSTEIKTPKELLSSHQILQLPPAPLKLGFKENTAVTTLELPIETGDIEQVEHFPSNPLTPLKYYHRSVDHSSPLRCEKVHCGFVGLIAH